MVSRIGPIALLPTLGYHVGPIRDNIKSAVAVTGIEKRKTLELTRIPDLEMVSWTPPPLNWTPHVKSANSL